MFQNFTSKCWMDKRLEIAPWKVELVQLYFSKESPGTSVQVVKNKNLEGREKSNCADFCPPPSPQGDSPKSLSKMNGQAGYPDDQLNSSPLPRLKISRPKLISKMKMTQSEDQNDVSRLKPVQVQSRPQITIDKRKFPIKKIVQDKKDQGSNCVSVVLRSSSYSPAMKLSETIRVVEDLSSKYPVKYEGKSENSRRSAARLDFCFHSAKNAGFFFKEVNALVRSGTIQKKIAVIQYAEKSLGRFGLIFLLLSVHIILFPGYQYPPVLTEKDLLTVQSPDYCANIFKTSVEDIFVFMNSDREITYVFRNVTDVNLFLFEVTGKTDLRTLGTLKENSKNLVLDPQDGYFVLNSTTDKPLALEKAGFKYHFEISTKNALHGSELKELKFVEKSEM